MVLSEAEGLLRIAVADLETAEASSDPKVYRQGAWGFWLQQSVKKALKAWLVHLGEIPPPTHDLSRLLRLLEHHQVATETLRPLGQLTIYAVEFTYDADLQSHGHDCVAFQLRMSQLPKDTLGVLKQKQGEKNSHLQGPHQAKSRHSGGQASPDPRPVQWRQPIWQESSSRRFRLCLPRGGAGGRKSK